MKDIVEVLKLHSAGLSMKRFDETKEMLEATFLIEFEDFAPLEASKRDLLRLSDDIRITFLDNKGIGELDKFETKRIQPTISGFGSRR